MVVVDTGSEDRTKTIAGGLGAQVVEFPWVDSFARARNEAIRHATGDWIFWLDADDRVEGRNKDQLQRLFSALPRNEVVGYSMNVECVARPGESPTVVDHVRLFPRHSAIRWEYRVHENILPSINRIGGRVEFTDITIRHYGYLDGRLREKKRSRDHALLVKTIEEYPNDPFVNFNLGHSYIDMGRFDEAVSHLRESIERSEPQYSHVKKAYVLLARAEKNRGNLMAALQVIDEGRSHHPTNPELLYFKGVYEFELGQLEECSESFNTILNTKSWPKEFASFDIGILNFKARHRLALAYEALGEVQRSEELLRNVLEENCEYVLALSSLGRLLARRKEHDEARTLAEALRQRRFFAEASFVEGLILKSEQKYGEAESTLKRAVELEDSHEEAYFELGEIYERQGKPEEAEKSFAWAVALRKNHPEPHYRLAEFLSRSDRMNEARDCLSSCLELSPVHRNALSLRDRIESNDRESV